MVVGSYGDESHGVESVKNHQRIQTQANSGTPSHSYYSHTAPIRVHDVKKTIELFSHPSLIRITNKSIRSPNDIQEITIFAKFSTFPNGHVLQTKTEAQKYRCAFFG